VPEWLKLILALVFLFCAFYFFVEMGLQGQRERKPGDTLGCMAVIAVAAILVGIVIAIPKILGAVFASETGAAIVLILLVVGGGVGFFYNRRK
jgi:hypothetical protein